MRFPCCDDRWAELPRPQLEGIEAALLRQFIRFNIPPEPRACKIRTAVYLRELDELIARSELAREASGAIDHGDFLAGAKRLSDRAEADYAQIRRDPYSYKNWEPSSEDWRRLAICQSMWAHDSKVNEPELLVPMHKRGRGRPQTGIYWTYAAFVEMALRKLAKEGAVTEDQIEQGAAAAEAVKLMKEAVKAGQWNGDIPEATTIEVAWGKLHLDDSDRSPAPPPAVQFRLDVKDHLKRIESVADRLGMRRNLTPEFSEFAGWAAEKVRPATEMPPYVRCWWTYGLWIKNAPVAVQTTYKAILSEFYDLTS